MDLTGLPIFELLHKKMTWLTQRQQVVSENLANADTPGYQAKIVKEPDFSQYLGGVREKLGVTTTSPRHFKGREGLMATTPASTTRSGDAEASPDGNSVNLTEEAMKIADTQMQYNMATNLYKKHVQMLRTALGRQGG